MSVRFETRVKIEGYSDKLDMQTGYSTGDEPEKNFVRTGGNALDATLNTLAAVLPPGFRQGVGVGLILRGLSSLAVSGLRRVNFNWNGGGSNRTPEDKRASNKQALSALEALGLGVATFVPGGRVANIVAAAKDASDLAIVSLAERVTRPKNNSVLELLEQVIKPSSDRHLKVASSDLKILVKENGQPLCDLAKKLPNLPSNIMDRVLSTTGEVMKEWQWHVKNKSDMGQVADSMGCAAIKLFKKETAESRKYAFKIFLLGRYQNSKRIPKILTKKVVSQLEEVKNDWRQRVIQGNTELEDDLHHLRRVIAEAKGEKSPSTLKNLMSITYDPPEFLKNLDEIIAYGLEAKPYLEKEIKKNEIKEACGQLAKEIRTEVVHSMSDSYKKDLDQEVKTIYKRYDAEIVKKLQFYCDELKKESLKEDRGDLVDSLDDFENDNAKKASELLPHLRDALAKAEQVG